MAVEAAAPPLSARRAVLACPTCGADLEHSSANGDERFECARNHSFPIVDGIPRFVESEHYAGSFGFQWKYFSRVQLDSYNGSGFSEARFRSITEWEPRDLQGKLVLDAGCGAGRFAEVALKTFGADLVACDLSQAVEACRDNLRPARPLICQASIFTLPFKPDSFDFVYCIGVLQHTPDPHAAIRALCRVTRPGGRIGLWIYELNWKSFLGTAAYKYAFRPFTRRMSTESQLRMARRLTAVFYPIVRLARHAGLAGKTLMRLLPVASAHLQGIELSDEDFKTWVFLDTFDMYSPAFDKPQTLATVVRLLEEEGFSDIRRHPHGALSITAIKQRAHG